MKKITFKFGDICRKVCGTLAVVVIFLMPASRSVLGEVANKGMKSPGQKSLLQARGEQQEQMRGGNQNDSDSSNSASCPSTGSAISPVRNSSGGSSSSSESGSYRMLNIRPAAK